MIAENIALQYHDRFTRGELLTAEEQAELTAWYAYQDGLEAHLVNGLVVKSTISGLPAQIEAILMQTAAVTQRVQSLMAENQTLRHEISTLRQQFVQLSQARQMSHDYA